MIKVEVTQEDIDNGPKWINAKMCPVAMALKRALGNQRISVAPTYFCFYDENDVTISNHMLPKGVPNFIINYDSHMEVKPFTFEIDLIDNDFCEG